MTNKGVCAIFQYPYYDTPYWLDINEHKDYAALSGSTTENEVDSFILKLIGYNDIDSNREPNVVFDEFISKESIILAGGLMFFNDNIRIFPSCCCGLEGWRDIQNSILKGSSPWMGHSPSPTFEYKDDKIYIWSDDILGVYGMDISREDMEYIEFDRNDLLNQVMNIENDLKAFAKSPFYKRLKSKNVKRTDEIVEKFLYSFDVERK